MLAILALISGVVFGLMTAAMGAVVWRGPPPSVEKPMQVWLGRVFVLVVLIAATSLSGLIYRQANSQAMSKAAETYGIYD